MAQQERQDSGAEWIPLGRPWPSSVRPLGALWWKRPLDVSLCVLALVFVVPVILVIALCVVLESRGSVFFSQERVGRLGVPFRLWKIRTMYVNCDQRLHHQAAAAWFAGQAVSGDRYKTLSDPRITRVGRVLRKLNLDELPQLFNVLRGDMSLVGPRPAIPYELMHYEPAWLERLQVPPGLTGLWQVTRRERLSAAEMMELDARYVQTASLSLDLKIIFLTAPAVIAGALGGS